MAIKIYKPTTPGRRQTSVLLSHDLTGAKKIKKLFLAKKRMAGRNNQGKITVRHQGGGSRKLLRVVDFKRDKFDIPAKVLAIEYDPNRNTRLALVVYADGEKRYLLAPDGLKTGNVVRSSRQLIEFKVGNHLPLKYIPTGMFVFNVEMTPGRGAQIGRSAGANISLMGFDRGLAQLKLPSGEIRLVDENCLATIGSASNPDYKNIRWGKAGRNRHRGIRPSVRGKAMNPVDHPHGGGEGVNPIGLKHPKTPWGKPALGVKTRKLGKRSQKFILQRRPSRKKKK